MSDKLSSITAKKALKKLKKAGFIENHQREGKFSNSSAIKS